MRLGKILALAVLAVLAIALGLLVVARREARADPVVRRAAIALPDWPADAPPLRITLASDFHLGNRATDAARLERIVTAIAASRPDLVLLAGDFIAGHQPGSAEPQAAALARAFARLRPRLGVIATLGNHDYWTGEDTVRRALARAGVTVLENGVARRGPLLIAGVGDAWTGHDRTATTLARTRGEPGPLLVVAHSPDIAPALPPRATLLLAGHTHCGQVVLPLVMARVIPSRFGTRYRCGVIREGRRRTIVTAGTGTSGLPLRLGAPPDIWAITLGR